ncbi:transposase [Salipaludibacillus sp. LMS25]|jgi:transposase|uniref:transposase n=1 Tax=Salipaludibacillus sp. LMS25 TaxID=2924031 RepID=UPI0020D08132|nr:transposase [Salipaludibacillus sp. LMS25]UTR16382.1 transposase [Salipaludibacillus sp. LMS25]
MRKSYDKDFKLLAVQMIYNGKWKTEVARELDLAEQTLHNWVKKYDQNKTFVGSGNLSPEDKEERDE